MGSGRFRALFEFIYIAYWRQWQEAFVLRPKLEEKGRAYCQNDTCVRETRPIVRKSGEYKNYRLHSDC